ncbi:MAG: Lrp/AsnC family transcriptional regulator [Thermodesulfobacteriota bacterium]
MSEKSEVELSSVEKRIIFELGGDIGAGPRPFAELGRKVGLTEAEVLTLVQRLMDKGVLRRFGATLRHQRTGFIANAMVAWRSPEERLEEAGRLLGSFPEVTHCYQRRTMPEWSKNLYTMIHASSEEECLVLIKKMAAAAGLDDYELLFSREELKKTSMRYFR